MIVLSISNKIFLFKLVIYRQTVKTNCTDKQGVADSYDAKTVIVSFRRHQVGSSLIRSLDPGQHHDVTPRDNAARGT